VFGSFRESWDTSTGADSGWPLSRGPFDRSSYVGYPQKFKYMSTKPQSASTSFHLTLLTVSVLLVLVGCGREREKEFPAKNSSAGQLPPTAASLLKMPAELDGKQPVVQGQAAIGIVNEKRPDVNTPQEQVFEAESGGKFWIRGWAFDDKRKTLPPVVYIELLNEASGLKLFIDSKRVERPDIVSGFKYPWALLSGFDSPVLDQHGIPPGKYLVSIYQIDPEMVVKTPFYGGAAKVIINFR
jgi:hypothetical protein